MASMIAYGLYPCVLGSRILGGYALRGGMPLWKYVANRVLTFAENILLGRQAFRIPHRLPRLFARTSRTPAARRPTRTILCSTTRCWRRFFGSATPSPRSVARRKYFDEASSINFRRSVKYGFGCLGTALAFRLAKMNLRSSKLFPPPQ